MFEQHRSAANRDDGMSIVEVLIASVILLVALTAMLGLLLTSTGLSSKARAQGLAVTTANRFIETVRQTNYSSLNQSRLNQLASSASGTVGGMTVSVTASMTAHFEASQPASSTPAYQEVKVTVSVTGPGLKAFTFHTGTFVREWRYSGTDQQVDPTADFDDQTPPAGLTARPIWATVHIGATARSNMTDVVLTQMRLVWRPTSVSGVSIIASSTPNVREDSLSTGWDTTAVPEGRRGTMYVEVWDALNNDGERTRDFLIDNVVPPAPSSVALASTVGNSQLTWSWPTVMDGETAVSSYEPTVYQLLPQTSGSYNEWVTRLQPAVGTPSFAFASTPFSFYQPSVISIGPREVSGLGTWRSGATSGSAVLTRPGFTTMNVSLTQGASNKYFDFTASSLALTPPTFRVISQSYKWEYKMGTGAWTAFASSTSPNTNPSSATTVSFPKVTAAAKGEHTTLSFRCTGTVTRPNNTTWVNKSAIMTVNVPTSGNSSRSYTLPDFTSDWTTSW